MMDLLRQWARGLKRDAVTIWLVARDPRTPRFAKFLALFVAAYAFSPIDLIPDFIPVLGYLDDLIIVPLGIWWVMRLIPESLLEENRKRAETMEFDYSSRWAAVIILSIWVILLIFLIKILSTDLLMKPHYWLK